MNKLSFALAGALIAGCGGSELAQVGETGAGMAVPNGIRLNGVRLNGVRLNGIRLNGVRLNGVRLNGVRLNGTSLTSVEADGSSLDHQAMAGALLDASLSDGTTVFLRVDGVHVNAGDDLVRYDLKLSFDGHSWGSLCGESASGEPLRATFAAGVWNQEQGVPGGGAWSPSDEHVTVACENSAIFKCMDAGYKPWALNETAYPTRLLACVRMIRADYCGNGSPWTVDGRTLDVWDDQGIQTRSTDWPIEAEWGPDGAGCLNRPRVIFPDNAVPACVQEKMARGCSRNFKPGFPLRDAPESTLATDPSQQQTTTRAPAR